MNRREMLKASAGALAIPFIPNIPIPINKPEPVKPNLRDIGFVGFFDKSNCAIHSVPPFYPKIEITEWKNSAGVHKEYRFSRFCFVDFLAIGCDFAFIYSPGLKLVAPIKDSRFYPHDAYVFRSQIHQLCQLTFSDPEYLASIRLRMMPRADELFFDPLDRGTNDYKFVSLDDFLSHHGCSSLSDIING